MKKNLPLTFIWVILLVILAGVILISYKVEKGKFYPSQKPSQPTYNFEAISPVNSSDWIRGDINSPVKLIEYSDLECPFCKSFHSVLQQIVREYQGKVAWVYRHFPLTSLHSKAQTEAEAAECVGFLGGNSAFWVFIDEIFKITPSNDGLDLKILPDLAEKSGVNKENFKNCFETRKYKNEVEKDLQEAQRIGLTGTPTTIIIGPNQEKEVILGARSYAQVKDTIEALLKSLETR